MDVRDPYLQPPEADARLWRYMSLPKFLTTLEHRGLFFVRASRFKDPFEGSYPAGTIASDVMGGLSKIGFNHWNRHLVLVSCWHSSQCESAALWNIYAAEAGGIALVTKAGKLASVLPEDVIFAKVRYIDYASEPFPPGHVLYPFVHKRQSFAHEAEVRGLRWQSDLLPSSSRFEDTDAPTSPGEWIDTGLAFVDEIRLAPAMPNWLDDLARALVQRYKCEIPVRRSDMDVDPLF